MKMDTNSLLTLIALLVSNIVLVVGGIARQESRMTRMETLIDGLTTKLSEEISDIRAHFRDEIADLKTRLRELEGQIRR